jgi:protein LTV1
VPKITLDPKTGLPTLNGDHQAPESRKGRHHLQSVAEDEDSREASGKYLFDGANDVPLTLH